MSTAYGALVVFGSGPGVGRNVAALFAERGFEKIILISRDATRLSHDAAFVRSAARGVGIHEIPTDLGDMDQVQRSLRRVETSLQDTPLHCVLFNAARTGKSEFFTFAPENLNNDLQVGDIPNPTNYLILSSFEWLTDQCVDRRGQSLHRRPLGFASSD